MISFLKKVIKRFLNIGIPVNSFSKPIFCILYFFYVFLREFLIWIFRFFYFEPIFKSQCQEVGKCFWMEKMPYIVNSGRIFIGDNVRFSGKPMFAFSTHLSKFPLLKIGSNSFIGHQATFAVGKSISIGRNCFIAGGARFADNDGHPINYLDRRNHLPPSYDDVKEILVGDDVWIGANAVILKGVKIGDRSIVGICSVVTKDVPPDTIVAGNPARIIKLLK